MIHKTIQKDCFNTGLLVGQIGHLLLDNRNSGRPTYQNCIILEPTRIDCLYCNSGTPTSFDWQFLYIYQNYPKILYL